MTNAPPLPPAERLAIILMALIQALAARAGWRLPPSLIALIEDHLRGIGQDFALLAASVEARPALSLTAQSRPAPIRAAPGTHRSSPRRAPPHRAPQAAPATPLLPLPLWESAGERGRAAEESERAAPLTQPSLTKGASLKTLRGPPFPAQPKLAPWHVHFVTFSN